MAARAATALAAASTANPPGDADPHTARALYAGAHPFSDGRYDSASESPGERGGGVADDGGRGTGASADGGGGTPSAYGDGGAASAYGDGGAASAYGDDAGPTSTATRHPDPSPPGVRRSASASSLQRGGATSRSWRGRAPGSDLEAARRLLAGRGGGWSVGEGSLPADHALRERGDAGAGLAARQDSALDTLAAARHAVLPLDEGVGGGPSSAPEVAQGWLEGGTGPRRGSRPALSGHDPLEDARRMVRCGMGLGWRVGALWAGAPGTHSRPHPPTPPTPPQYRAHAPGLAAPPPWPAPAPGPQPDPARQDSALSQLDAARRAVLADLAASRAGRAAPIDGRRARLARDSPLAPPSG